MIATITDEMVSDFKALLAKHDIKDIYVPSAVGQLLGRVEDCTLSNTLPWCNEGLVFEKIKQQNIVQIVKDIAIRFDGKHLNYNDLDCDIWSKTVSIKNPCIHCSCEIFEKLGMNADKATCTRCNGTGIDPKNTTDGYVFIYNDHGNSCGVVVTENTCCFSLHIRKFPYNQSNRQKIKQLKEFLKSSTKEQYDADSKYLRYHDSRDEGFVLSTHFWKDYSGVTCETSMSAPFYMSMIEQHLQYVKPENGDIECIRSF